MTAYANKAKGGGFEDYAGCNVVFGGIENVHAVRNAWQAMGSAVRSLNDEEAGTWFKDVANSGWYDLMAAIIQCTRQVVNEIQLHRCNVLIHCSDGWDRTAQVGSLAMICMDSYYRTIVGLFVLIQKEFCSFGHPFATRLALGERPSSEFSPVFLQWLECVYQVVIQFPTAFEYTPALLLRLGSEALLNRYGTFLTDSERERSQKVAPRTLSLWSALLDSDIYAELVNPSYHMVNETLWLNPCQAGFRIWKAYWFRYAPGARRQRPAETNT